MAQPGVLELVGRIDNDSSADVESKINAALDGSPSVLVLDFSGITFVSSSGLRVLPMMAKRCRKQNTALALHSVAPAITESFRMSGLKAFFPVHESRDAALAAVAQSD